MWQIYRRPNQGVGGKGRRQHHPTRAWIDKVQSSGSELLKMIVDDSEVTRPAAAGRYNAFGYRQHFTGAWMGNVNIFRPRVAARGRARHSLRTAFDARHHIFDRWDSNPRLDMRGVFCVESRF